MSKESTLLSQLASSNNRPSGFDYLRLSLAVSIVIWHSLQIVYGGLAEDPIWNGPLGWLIRAFVPSFFALSGFLVAGSLERNDLPSFLTLRSIRIFPALAVEVVISGLIIGVLLTHVALSQYFSHIDFWKYFLNIFGVIHYYLPGVFDDQPMKKVNAQLWTVPFELQCYLLISVLALIKLHRRPMVILITASLLSVVGFGFQFFGEQITPRNIAVSGNVLIICFVAGVALYAGRAAIPFRLPLFIVSLIATIVFLTFQKTTYLASVPIAYVTVYLGLLDPKRLRVIRGADYSYGIYLYGYPIQQTAYAIAPWAHTWFSNALLSLTATAGLAAFSWHMIENPILGHKKVFLAWVRGITLRTPIISRLIPAASGGATR